MLKKSNQSIRLSFWNCALLLGAVFCTFPVAAVLAQSDVLADEVSIDSFLDQANSDNAATTNAQTTNTAITQPQENASTPAPAQDDLSLPAAQEDMADDTGRLSIDDVLAEDEPIEEYKDPSKEAADQEDALPQVRTTLRIETEGFDYGADKNLTTYIDSTKDREKTQKELAEQIRREAYDAAITGLFPLQPNQIKALIKEYDKTRAAVEEPVHGIPTPIVNVETISLDPGVPPSTIKTAVGHITTVNILDVTGAPWPIQDISWAGEFEVVEPEEGGHIIRITPMGKSAYGNMSVRLLTLKTPVTFMLKTGTDEVQYRVDARIPEYGPFAKAQLIDGGTELVAGNALITSVLDGTPPGTAERLEVSGVDGRTSAYKISGMTYVRTPLTLLSPGWEHSVSSADGMNVYALEDTPVLLLSDQGRFMRAGLSERRNVLGDE
ncbi:MAG: DotH/IcmK family type IV secretion protein [Alphaproteobacteria bacterium]|nr:DotH/IcmK family type IV secretion protein [Alphaproteobacteria bacterium]